VKQIDADLLSKNPSEAIFFSQSQVVVVVVFLATIFR
jgi:hypothetical protein